MKRLNSGIKVVFMMLFLHRNAAGNSAVDIATIKVSTEQRYQQTADANLRTEPKIFSIS